MAVANIFTKHTKGKRMILIKIDRSSILKNPNAGRDRMLLPGRCHTEEDGSVTRPMQTIYFPPEPEYLFSHIPTQVKCNYCGSIFMHNELLDEWSEDDDGLHIQNVCPKCSAGFCCQTKFEEFNISMVHKQ